jgi:hypothetical protein
MQGLVTDEQTIRPYWPLPQRGGGRTSYGVPLILAATGVLALLLCGWVAAGMPVRRGILNFVLLAAVGVFAAIHLANLYDGTAIRFNREHVVLTKWFRRATVMSVSDIGRIVLCSVEVPSRYGATIKPAAFFFDRDGRCVISLFSQRFHDQDLARLWTTLNIKPEGSWSDRVPQSKLKSRFPGAFDKRAA